jgi:lipoprotein-releasing system ATP-binding protein
MSDPVLELDGVVKDYVGAVTWRALHGIDLVVRAGEFAAIVGPSGSGKSTLLNLLGLLDRPTAGTLRIRGRDVASLDEDELTSLRGESLGFVFQFHHLIPSLTAAENVMMPLAIADGATSPEALARARELLDDVGLGDRAGSLVGKLSGGQQQRVAIARALVRRPPIVLADEPTGNLDTRLSDEAFALMRRYADRLGAAFLIVTHDPRLAERCDRIIEIVDGRIRSDRRRDGRAALEPPA